MFVLKDYITGEKISAEEKGVFLELVKSAMGGITGDDDVAFWRKTAYGWVIESTKNIPNSSGVKFKVDKEKTKGVCDYVKKGGEKMFIPKNRVSVGWIALTTGEYPIWGRLGAVLVTGITKIANALYTGYLLNTGYTANYTIRNLSGERLLVFDGTNTIPTNIVADEIANLGVRGKFVIVEDYNKILVGDVLPTKYKVRLIAKGGELIQREPTEEDFKVLKTVMGKMKH